MDPTALTLEMTENIFIEDSERARTVLADLKELGVRLALDDFGTGYSSLSYLRRLPIDIVKIDQGFVADIGDAPTGVAIVEAVTNLAHVLGLTVIAEGVETQSQHDEVSLIGCESAQGFFYARPMPTSEISAQLGAYRPGDRICPPNCQTKVPARRNHSRGNCSVAVARARSRRPAHRVRAGRRSVAAAGWVTGVGRRQAPDRDGWHPGAADDRAAERGHGIDARAWRRWRGNRGW